MMNSKQLESNFVSNVKKMENDIVHDAREELAHVIDPSQCGVVVRNHFPGLMIALYVFIFVVLAAAIGAIRLYARH